MGVLVRFLMSQDGGFPSRGVLLRASGAQDGEGEIQTSRKKIVSKFSKQRMGRISFLNPPEQCRLPSCRPMSLFFRQITSRCLRDPYESLRTF